MNKDVAQWLENIKPLIVNFDDKYGDAKLQEALEFVQKSDIANLNHCILVDEDGVSSYKKDSITYAKIIYYAKKISKQNILNSIDNLDTKIQELIQKRDKAILLIDNEDMQNIGYKQNFIQGFNDKQTNIFIGKDEYFSNTDKNIIQLFGVFDFFDSNFNHKTAQRLQECFIEYEKNKQQNNLLDNGKNSKQLGSK